MTEIEERDGTAESTVAVAEAPDSRIPVDSVPEDLRPHVRRWLTLLATDQKRAVAGLRHGTVINYLSAVVTYGEWLALQAPRPEFKDMTPVVGYRFVHWLQLEKLFKPSTIQLKVSALSSLWTYLASEGFVPSNPWAVVKVPSALRGRPKNFSASEDEAMLGNAKVQNDKDFFCALLTMRFAGLRISEVFALRPEDVEFRPEVPGGKRQDLVRIRVHGGKGGKDRTTFFVEYPNERGLDSGTYQGLFLKFAASRAGEKFLFPRKKTLFVDWYERRRKAGDLPPDFRPHRLRHTFAKSLADRGYQVEVVQNCLGHESPETTMIYYELDPDELERRVREQDLSEVVVGEGPGSLPKAP